MSVSPGPAMLEGVLLNLETEDLSLKAEMTDIWRKKQELPGVFQNKNIHANARDKHESLPDGRKQTGVTGAPYLLSPFEQRCPHSGPPTTLHPASWVFTVR